MTPVKILVVDDEIELERLIKQRFRKRIKSKELDFVFASNGIEALHQLQHDSQVDMVLTDINMPQMDGLTLIGWLPKISETLKAVVMSASSDMSNIRQAMNRGAFDFLTKPIDFQDLEQTIEKTMGVVQEIKDKKLAVQKTQDQLLQAAFHDSLTGLPNRAWLSHRLTQIFEQHNNNQQSSCAVLFVDLDGFKQVNDQMGHLMGDVLLKSVAERLKLCLRDEDVIARLGGDEFVILLESLRDIEYAKTVAERIQDYLKQPFQLGDMEVYCGASIGIAFNSKRYQQPEDLLKDSDFAMYAAKAQGKGRYEIFD